MKTFIFQYVILLSLTLFNRAVFGAGAGSFNGVQLGKSKKTVGNNNPTITQRYSADPGVMVYNGRVYVYATNDGNGDIRNPPKNEYGQIREINVMSSADLVNWQDHGQIKAAGSGGAAKWASNSWAPCACHKKINGKEQFFVYFANNASGIGVLVSDSPTGPFRDPIGRALISRQTPNSNVEWLFDPACLVDDDGNGYLYYGGGVPSGRSANPNTIRVAKLGNDMISISGTPKNIDAPWVFEDSGINKIGNTYYYSYCTNWNGGPYGNARIAYMTSNNPMGPFTFKGTLFNNPGDFFQTTGNNHHTIIEFKSKYYIFYHAEWLNKQNFGEMKGYRTTHVDVLPMNGGSFGQAKGTLKGVTQVANVNGSALNYASSFAWQSGITIDGNGAVTRVKYGKGAWTGVSNVNLGGSSKITLRASAQSGATIKITSGSENGTVLGYVEIPAGNSLQTVTGTLTGASGTKHLFFISSNNAVIESWTLGDGTGESTDPVVDDSPKPGYVTTDIVDGWYYIRGVASDKYLTAENAVNDGRVIINSFYGYEDQKWKVTRVGDYITLTNGMGEFNIDISNGKNEDNAKVVVYRADSNNKNQQFLLKSAENQSFQITSRVSDGERALDVMGKGTDDGTVIHQYSITGGDNQKWYFESLEKPKKDDGKKEDDKKDEQCWAKALGYECCKSCLPVFEKDADGEWAIDGEDWCGIPKSCSASKCEGAQGYPCCKKTCDIISTDEDGNWGIENDDWCLIDKSVC